MGTAKRLRRIKRRMNPDNVPRAVIALQMKMVRIRMESVERKSRKGDSVPSHVAVIRRAMRLTSSEWCVLMKFQARLCF